MSIRVSEDWWKTLFDEVYLLTDARSVCDDVITRKEVDLIFELLPISRGQEILDLCGGHGRHSLELCSRGEYRCTLVDYSAYLIRQAKKNAEGNSYNMQFVQADARKTALSCNSFDHVLIMGNSLGYFSDADGDGQILSEAFRVLRPGGWLLVDVVDGRVVRDSLNPNAWHEIAEDLVVCRHREIRGNGVCARELVISKEKGLIRDRTYAIRIYEFDALSSLLEQAGFEHISIITDFSCHRSQGDYGFMNHRMIATGRKRWATVNAQRSSLPGPC
jgi:D-alanine-D-alanine ligase